MEYNHPKLLVSHLLSLSVATLLVKTKSCSYTYSQLVACLCPIFHKIISESWTSKKHMKPPEQVKLHNSLHEMSIFLDAANTHTLSFRTRLGKHPSMYWNSSLLRGAISLKKPAFISTQRCARKVAGKMGKVSVSSLFDPIELWNRTYLGCQ